MSYFVNHTGKRFGILTATRLVSREAGKVFWECLCDCGKRKILLAGTLVQYQRSCGCRQGNYRHGKARKSGQSVEYHSYCAARARCTNPKNNRYYRYGGRGIEFRFNSFEEFYAELGDKPDLKHTVDRIDPEGHYEKGNVRWATNCQPRNNRAKK